MRLRHVLACVWATAGGLLPLPQSWAAPPAQTLVAGAEDDAGPWSYADGTGYVNDVVRAAFESVGWSVRFETLPYARCKAMLLSGQLAACFSTSRTAELAPKLLFSREPVIRAQNLLLARAESPLAGCKPAAWPGAPRIGIVRSYEYIAAVERLFDSGAAQREVADSEVSNLRKVRAGHLDAAVINVDGVKRIEYVIGLAQVDADGLKTVCNFGSEPAFVAFSPVHPQGAAARAAFDRGHALLRQNGRINTLQQLWRLRALDSARAKRH
jgi:ABC-type amino acid transport substrate-binding protein